MNNKKTSLKKMWLNGHLFSDHFSISSRRRERLPVLSLVMKILRKPKIEDIVCNIQNNEEDKKLLSYSISRLLENQSRLSAADILQNRMMNIVLDCLRLTKQLNSIHIKRKSFLAFADLLIKRDVIDYIRKESKHNLVF